MVRTENFVFGSKMAAAAILNFENVNISLDEDISTKFGGQMHHGHV